MNMDKLVGVTISVLLLTLHGCWTAPCATDSPSATTASSTHEASADASTSTMEPPTLSARELEIANLENLRTGIDVVHSVAKVKLSKVLHIPEEHRDILDDVRNATGFNFALLTMCDINKALLNLWEIPPETVDTDITLLRATTHALLRSTCQWVNEKSRKEFSHTRSDFELSCTSPEINIVCMDVETLVFAEKLEQQLSSYHDNAVSSERWIAKNIRQDDVLPEVYDVISGQ